eukprot:767337-Hanusia_phi.AAC.8
MVACAGANDEQGATCATGSRLPRTCLRGERCKESLRTVQGCGEVARSQRGRGEEVLGAESGAEKRQVPFVTEVEGEQPPTTTFFVAPQGVYD